MTFGTIILLYKIAGLSNQTEVNACEILEVSVILFALKALYCSKGAPQKCKSEHCSNVGHDRCMWLTQGLPKCKCFPTPS